ncbi:MAG: helix-turn-helix domain-containing protein [Planctomycetes bacterium]|nr:helix-turn-helix domain-containing protein [Planctomycetota bacterium]
MKNNAMIGQVPQRALGINDSAKYLGISVTTLRRLVKRGAIKPSRLSARLLFDVRDLDALFEQGKQESA